MPAGDRLKAFPATITAPLQIDSSAERRAIEVIGKYDFAADRAFELKQLRMLQDGSYEGAQVEWPIGHADAMAVDGVGHVQLQGNEVEAIDALPVVETSIDFVRVADEKGSVFVVHSTILFLIEQSASFCHRGFWLLGWRPSKGARDAGANIVIFRSILQAAR